jgi:hypothetical protein
MLVERKRGGEKRLVWNSDGRWDIGRMEAGEEKKEIQTMDETFD